MTSSANVAGSEAISEAFQDRRPRANYRCALRGSVKMRGQAGGRGITLRSWVLREAAMDRAGLGEVEREIDAEAKERFPGRAVRQAVLLQYGDDPEIEPGDLWVRVLLAADGPGDYQRSVQAFQHDREAAI